MRLFVGIELPEDIKKTIEGIEKELKKKVKEARVVKKENLHITLKFLGEVIEKKIAEIDEKLREVSESFTPFNVCVGKIGNFPEGKRMRVLWVGVESNGVLNKINFKIEKVLSTIGFKEENRFKEHITIARFKSTPDMKFIEHLKEKYSSFLGEFRIKSFFLIKSNLTPEGPIYKNLKEYKLGGDNNGKREST